MDTPGSHEKISPTAWATAHARTFSDIPYSKEIFEWLENKRREVGQENLSTKMKETSLAINIESRYKMIDKVLRELKATQILETASGLAQRGLIMSTGPSITYVEMDLPGIMAEKKELVASLLDKEKAVRPNLFLESGNALSADDMKRAASHFSHDKPLFVVNEGLLRYLTFDEKTVYAANVRMLLKEFGGYWITPDVSIKLNTATKLSAERKRFNKEVEKATGFSITPNLFRDRAHAVEFLSAQGFAVEERPYSEVMDAVACVKALNIPQAEVEHQAKAVLLVMRAK